MSNRKTGRAAASSSPPTSPASPVTSARRDPHRKLEYLERRLQAAPAGAELVALVQAHAEEVMALINGQRRVAATWQRNQGPAFVRAIVDSGFDESSRIPKEVNGVTLEELLLRMAEALQRHGSTGLRHAIADHALVALRWSRECHSLQDLFGRIRDDAEEVPA